MPDFRASNTVDDVAFMPTTHIFMPTTHIISEHHRSARWIPLQLQQLERHLSGTYRTYTCLEGVDPSFGAGFTRVVPARGSHAGKLNHLARIVLDEADDDDPIVFLDGDAFPVRNLTERIEGWLSEHPLTAVRRDENLGDLQPHPCFCVTTVGLWRSLRGDWTAGHTWVASDGKPRTDVGGNLLYALDHANIAWRPLLRTNHHDLHPVFFGVYDHAVYHHGSGFRQGLSSAVKARSPRSRNDGQAGGIMRRLQHRQWVRREHAHMDVISDQVFRRLSTSCDDLSWLGEPGA
jgi:hypothetical protein